jgi:hypothetical protein
MIEVFSFLIKYARDYLGNPKYQSHTMKKKIINRSVTLSQYIEMAVDETKETALRSLGSLKKSSIQVSMFNDSTIFIHKILQKIVDNNLLQLLKQSVVVTVFDDHGWPFYSCLLNLKNVRRVHLDHYYLIKNKNIENDSIQTT